MNGGGKRRSIVVSKILQICRDLCPSLFVSGPPLNYLFLSKRTLNKTKYPFHRRQREDGARGADNFIGADELIGVSPGRPCGSEAPREGSLLSRTHSEDVEKRHLRHRL